MTTVTSQSTLDSFGDVEVTYRMRWDPAHPEWVSVLADVAAASVWLGFVELGDPGAGAVAEATAVGYADGEMMEASLSGTIKQTVLAAMARQRR